MSYTWKNPANARAASVLEERLERARLLELQHEAARAQHRARMIRQGNTVARKLETARARTSWADAEAVAVWARTRFPEDPEVGHARLEAATREVALFSQEKHLTGVANPLVGVSPVRDVPRPSQGHAA